MIGENFIHSTLCVPSSSKYSVIIGYDVMQHEGEGGEFWMECFLMRKDEIVEMMKQNLKISD